MKELFIKTGIISEEDYGEEIIRLWKRQCLRFIQ